MPNIPETAYLLYGGAQIGAVADYVDPRPESINLKVSANKILQMFKEEKCKYIICLDQCYLAMIKPIESELKELGLDKIIIVSATDSMNFKSTFNYIVESASFDGLKSLRDKLANGRKIQELIKEARSNSCIDVIDYSQFIDNSRYTQYNKSGYIPNKLDVIVHTSGTTSSKPKPIPLTNDNLNAYVDQTFCGNMPMNVGDKALHVLPYFAAFGVVDVAHAGLCHSNELIQIPEFSPSNLGKIIMKYKPNTLIGAPTWFINMMNDKNLKNADLSFLKMVTYGGDSMEICDEQMFNQFLMEHKCDISLTKGHGMSEIGGAGSFAIGEYNVPGSLGIPFPKTIYSIVNPDTREPIAFKDGQEEIIGESIISSPDMTSGILDGKIIVEHHTIDDIDFIFTRDIIKMNRDGVMSFLTRKDRSFTRFDGYKFKPYEIESVIKEKMGVKHCMLTPYYSEEEHGNMALLNLAIDDNLSDVDKVEYVKQLIEECFIKNENTSSRQIPTKYRFLDEFPITKNGKIDYKLLSEKQLDGNEVTVEIVENNISIDSINVIDPHNKSRKLSLK